MGMQTIEDPLADYETGQMQMNQPGEDMDIEQYHGVTMEEVLDEDEELRRWTPGRTYGTCESRYEKLKHEQER